MQNQSDDDNLNEGKNSISKFGWDVNIRSIHKGEFCNISVGSLIYWCDPSYEVVLSIVLPSKVVLSLFYQFLNLALKSPMAVIWKGFFCAKTSNVISVLSAKVSKSSWDWIGDLLRATKLQILSPIYSSKLRYSCK